MKETAVQWLFEEYKKREIATDEMVELFLCAASIEKHQIIDAWNDGYREFYDGSSTPEEYYNQTFKSE